jgi:hypothetical protein
MITPARVEDIENHLRILMDRIEMVDALAMQVRNEIEALKQAGEVGEAKRLLHDLAEIHWFGAEPEETCI